MSQLNEAQRAAAETTDGYVCAVAGAGAAATLALLVRYEDWDAAYAHMSFQVFFWITLGILVLIGVTGNVLMFRRRGPMLLLENLGVLTILVGVVTLIATFLFILAAIATIFKKDNR